MKDNTIYSANMKARPDKALFVETIETRHGTKYTKITETAGVPGGNLSKQRILLFQEDLKKLSKILKKAIKIADATRKTDVSQG